MITDFPFATHTYTTTSFMLKQQILELAGWIAPEESLTSIQASASLSMIVQRVAADTHTTPVQMALIARALADFIEQPK